MGSYLNSHKGQSRHVPKGCCIIHRRPQMPCITARGFLCKMDPQRRMHARTQWDPKWLPDVSRIRIKPTLSGRNRCRAVTAWKWDDEPANVASGVGVSLIGMWWREESNATDACFYIFLCVLTMMDGGWKCANLQWSSSCLLTWTLGLACMMLLNKVAPQGDAHMQCWPVQSDQLISLEEVKLVRSDINTAVESCYYSRRNLISQTENVARLRMIFFYFLGD